ncbi:MAG: 50S ribosomal protein L21e [Nanoarchaeota archaeon]|nr:50S ribosomal protein L21e [Nanoarchaeota archaeon]MBU4308531.1 50S ribosomal protein L21e [Nanoarchaeota archaeon]
MVRRKKIRTRGKLQLSRYFQRLKQGETVSVVAERALQPRFPKTLNGRTGVVEEKRGRSYVVKINDKNKEKTYIIEPIHLKKIKQIESKKDDKK